MAALLKDVYTQAYVTHIATSVVEHYSSFDSDGFINAVFNDDWQHKELKARTEHIAHQLHSFISLSYKDALVVIKNIAENFTGYEGMFTPAFVELYGIDEFSDSIDALAYITQFASSEFAVRPFIVQYPEKMHSILLDWSVDENEHVRRLASEGSRPRLPWAMALPKFKKDPSYILPILESLKNDPSEYVRRSVANNLNDIAKDHPQVVTTIATTWLNKESSNETKKLVKHACRSLLKQANPEALSLFGFLPPKNIEVIDFIADKNVKLGETLKFSCKLIHSQTKSLGKLRIEFAIDFMKKNNQQARKIFQISESVISKHTKTVEKSFSFKKISTRQYYCGAHAVAILVNGVQLCETEFILEN